LALLAPVEEPVVVMVLLVLPDGEVVPVAVVVLVLPDESVGGVAVL
jgi:hypothetical protein